MKFYFKLLTFIYDTQSVANENARIKALEIVSTNVLWLDEKEEEIIESFGGGKLLKKLGKDLASMMPKQTRDPLKKNMKSILIERVNQIKEKNNKNLKSK